MKHVLGGWNVSGVLRYESGRPMTITMNNDLAGLLFNTQKRPNQVGEGMADFGDFDPFTDRYYNRGGWADPGPLQFGNAPSATATYVASATSARTSTSSRSSRSPTRRSCASRRRSAICSTARSTAIQRRTSAGRTSGRCSRSATPRAPFSSVSGSTLVHNRTDTHGPPFRSHRATPKGGALVAAGRPGDSASDPPDVSGMPEIWRRCGATSPGSRERLRTAVQLHPTSVKANYQLGLLLDSDR